MYSEQDIQPYHRTISKLFIVHKFISRFIKNKLVLSESNQMVVAT